MVVGGKGLKEGHIEIKWRTAEAPDKVPLDQSVPTLRDILAERWQEDAAKVNG